MVYYFLSKNEKHGEISTYFRLKHRGGKVRAVYPNRKHVTTHPEFGPLDFSFFIHRTTPYIHLRLDSRTQPKYFIIIGISKTRLKSFKALDCSMLC